MHIRKVLRPAISALIFFTFLCLKAHAEMAPKFPVSDSQAALRTEFNELKLLGVEVLK
jgi:hypothetical protein